MRVSHESDMLKSPVLDQRLRKNNLDLLRFLFAFVVFLVHVHALSGNTSFSIFSDFLSSEIAVKAFFVVSGFLIFMSYENASGLGKYFSKRIRRIYPAYVFVILLFSVVGVFFSSLKWNEYFSLEFLKYIGFNIVFLNFLHPGLPGLFSDNAFQAVNGALWTLKIEVMFYLCVPLIVWASRKFGKAYVLIALYIGSVTYHWAMQTLADKTGVGLYLELQRQLPGQLAFFIAGAGVYYYFQEFVKYKIYLLALCACAFIFHDYLPWFMVQPFILGVLVLYFACLFPYLGNFGKYGDFSYGVYIYHFPILQLLIVGGVFSTFPWMALLAATVFTMTAAYLSWHWVEKRFLQSTSHYVIANGGKAR